jgi:hypothetical protein
MIRRCCGTVVSPMTSNVTACPDRRQMWNPHNGREGVPAVEVGGMNRRHLLAAAFATLALGSATAFAGAAGSGPLPSSGATPRLVKVAVRTSSYPVYDARGKRTGSARWRISPAGGNCCETYVSATPNGRVIESGGTYPWYTPDEGKHWYEVTFDIPDQNDNGPAIAGGEGATVTGPGGDVYGVTWDAYSGDHLQAYRYTAQSNTWQASEVVMKSPFYDRPWLTYAKGPFTLSGAKTAHVLDVTGGGLTKDIDTFSPDGLDYSDPSFSYYDEKQAPVGKFRIPVVRNSDADWWQPHPGTGTLPLSGGGVLRFANSEDLTGSKACPVARLMPATSTWQCVTTRGSFVGVVRQDSRGFLTEVYPSAGYGSLVLATSRDGGVHWSYTTLKPPPGAGVKLETQTLFDVVANGRLGQAVVSARFDDSAGNGHDMVFRVDSSQPRPRLLKTYLVGKGDLNTANDVTGSAGYRYDYESVAVLRNGHIAVSFDDSTCLQPTVRDSTHRAPEVAILM